jgi:hypothetical protein
MQPALIHTRAFDRLAFALTMTLDKAAYLAQTRGLGPTSGSLVFSERRAHRYGEVAVSIGRMRWEDEPERAAGQYLAVYVMRGGSWQPVAFQLTPAPRS